MWLGTPSLADTNFGPDLSIDRLNTRRTLLQQIDDQHRQADICATIFHCLGIDPEMPVSDRSGRPVSIAHGGQPIREILA